MLNIHRRKQIAGWKSVFMYQSSLLNKALEITNLQKISLLAFGELTEEI